ncbi:zinc finger protein 91 isoform X1 [Notolabrus celidotus]|uniref:zinc finger protein 91 isoform X1 n=1 Tax=Notolabrus celidotus TaxID=1203425 RepID=UPI00148F52EA|nr:zinc finger protein 91 isoform X1 [Notolabrus celidotus]
MDEAVGAAAAAVREDGAEMRPPNGDPASGDSKCPAAESNSERVGVFCCQDCGETFSEEAAYTEHCHQHSDKKNDGAEKDTEKHFCTLCSLSFVGPSEFHSHMEKTHGEASQKQPDVQQNPGTSQHTYECPDCGKCYEVFGHFLNHQRSHRQASKSVFHDLEHLKKKSFQCESCGRSYSRASALDAHRRCHEEKLVKARNKSSGDAVHTEESTVEAKPSPKQTDNTPEKKYKCSCGKAFTALMRLKTHQRFSRNSQCSPEDMIDKPKKAGSEFQCTECNKTFSSHIALFNHQRWHSNFSSDPSKKFPCELCGKAFVTLSFYYRHQRTVHSDETPAKSFLHQVCQLQKKAFECKDCGLKFSRESALHSHQLLHTDNFRETEIGQTPLHPEQNTLESERKDTEQEEMKPEDVLFTSASENEVNVDETDEDVECYGPGDFNVQVISASESEGEEEEEESVQDLNPDLELLCESDQEQRDDGDTGPFASRTFSKPELDLKIVQIDFEPADVQCAPIEREPEGNSTGERFDCPDCYRWFTSASSLRVHRMWHGIRKRKHQTQGQSEAAHTFDTCGHEASSFVSHRSHIQHHTNQNTNNDVMYPTEGSEKKNLTCNECGKCFSRLSALVSHQLHHPKRKQFQCPDCMMSYSYAASLFNHMKNCSSQKKDNSSDTQKAYNPKKTLLGPKLYHCEQCGKGFWSLGAYSHHKQNQTQCVDLRLRKGDIDSLHMVNGHSRSSVKVACPVCGRKFRHKGIMALHMRKHENGNHKCELCNRSFRLFSSLLRHQVVHSDQLLPPPIKSFQHQVDQLKKNTYSCPDCGKLFSRAKALQFHMKSHGYETGHSPSSPKSSVTLEDLQCATCLAHFNNKASLRAHQKLCIKRESQAFNCTADPSENDATKWPKSSMEASTPETSKQITVTKVKQEVDGEEQTAGNETGFGTNNLKYKCKKCDRSFSVIGALNFHKRIHVESYKPVVKSRLSMSVMLKKSKQEDSTKGLFHCSECGRRFMSNSALGSHRRWHKEKKLSRSLPKDDDLKSLSNKTDVGPFHCDKCGKQFFNHCVLQRHQMFNPLCQTKPEQEPDSDKITRSSVMQEKPEFSCPECKKTFVQHSLLAAHCENEHSQTLKAAHLQGHHHGLVEEVQEHVDTTVHKCESVSSNVKHKVHQCPLCSLAFAKARGLRAHRWQVHSRGTKSKSNLILSIKNPLASSSEVSTDDSSVVENAIVKDIPVGREKKIKIDPSPVKLSSCLNSVKQSSSAGGAIFDHTKEGLEVKHGSKQEILTPETTAEISPPGARLSEHTVKCLFKCDKCGKAFQTEEQLGSHKTKAKSRPYCCALCCQGFWTESQLQQHLAWHDEVRCRLPNEVRYRLSAALTSKPLKLIMASASTKGKSSPIKPDSLSQNSHKCQHCGKAFLSPSALQKHETQHCNDSYHCSICPRTFSEIQDLIDHHQECIGDYKKLNDAPAAVTSGETTGLTCLECGTTFSQETDLHQHYTEHARGVF